MAGESTERHGNGSRETKESAGAAPLPYQVVTDRIVAMLEAGEVPWRKPWAGGGLPKNLASGRGYRGVNVFMLACVAAMSGYGSSWWVTYRQAQELGGNVRKGEKSSPVVFWKILDRGRDAEESAEGDPSAAVAGDGERADGRTEGLEGSRKLPLLRYYDVFNIEQCEGIAPPPPAEGKQAPLEFQPIEACEAIVAGMPSPPRIEHGESRAYYRARDDLVNMPKRELFNSVEEYYATLFHELAHATGHESRLKRESVKDAAPFGSPTYAREELVAEMGAAFLCGRARIEQVTLANSAAYIAGWLKKLRDDAKLVVVAAAQAQKAADFISGSARVPEEESNLPQARLHSSAQAIQRRRTER